MTRPIAFVATILAVVWLALPTALGHADGPAPRSTLPSNRPNILLLVSDDQTWSTFNPTIMPHVYGDLVDKGVLFNRGYINASLCCPSRSEILTGLYAQHTGVDLQTTPLTRPTFPAMLHDVGYHTVLAGKYLNSYPCNPPKPEFDLWVCEGVGDLPDTMVNPTLNVNGALTDFTGYTTDILANYVTDFIASTPTDQPFFAMYTPISPHLPADDPRCAGVPVTPYRPASYDEDTETSGKPRYMAGRPLSSTEVTKIDSDFQAMTDEVPCLDNSIESILSSLGDREQETLVFFLSDNGYLYGEHRYEGKMVPYEPSVRVPFVIRYPALVPETAPFATDALAENVDIAATIADVLQVHWGGDGQSLLPILDGTATTVRDAALIENCEGVNYPCMGDRFGGRTENGDVIPPSFYGVATSQYKYVEYVTGEKELYDLSVDPDELVNLAGDPGYAGVQAELAADVASLTAPPVVDTTIVSGPQGAVDGRAFTFTYFSQSRFATYQCRLDKDAVLGTWYPCNGQSTVVGSLADGSYTFNVEGTDEFGSTDSTPDTRSFSVTTTGTDATITSAPASHQKSTTATFGFTSTDPAATFQCRNALYGTVGVWASCAKSTGVTYSGLADGLYSFEVEATHPSGSTTDPPAEFLYRVDNAAPVMTFTAQPQAFTNQTSATIGFYPDEVTTGGYTCSLDGGASTDCSGRTYSASGLGAGKHTLTVAATDELGNSGSTKFSWTVDLTAPVATITVKPSNPSNGSPSFKFSSTEPQNGAFECSLDGGIYEDCQSPLQYFGLTDGSHTFQVVAIDVAENVSAPAAYTWTVDATAPTATILTGPANPTKSKTATFTFSSTESGTFQCSIDGAAFAGCVSGKKYTRLAEGAHTFQVLAVDAVGNQSAPATWSWTVDVTGPITTITSGPANPTTSTTATFTFTANETVSSFSCSIDSGKFKTCVSGITYNNLAVGSHTFSVKAKDLAGNTGASATWTWTITT